MKIEYLAAMFKNRTKILYFFPEMVVIIVYTHDVKII